MTTDNKKIFKGTINLDVRDSKPDWSSFIPAKAPEGAPNVLLILFDDTGMASWSPYGGKIQMPTLQKLADNGLTYTQWHTTALCSPTRSCLLTGRNHHQNGFACIVEGSTGYPGSSAYLPDQCAPMAKVLQKNGWNTYWVGKNHNVPEEQNSAGASKKYWPLQQGFDRFYGYIGGETNNWYPDLTEDNKRIDQPYSPEDGYHLSKDLADNAMQIIRDSQASAPSRPWFMWFCPGANHAPHHSPKEWADKYKGQFDDGYEAYREWVLKKMKEKGIMPESTGLTEINPMPEGTFDPNDEVRPWNTLSTEEKKLFSRMAEVFAGFSEYTDHQIGRIIDYLKESNQLDNTIVIYCADNGASGEGSPSGSVNENKFFNNWPDDIKENLKYLDELGSPNTYNHYPTGWAVAFSTPFKMFKRYSYAGGTCDPLVISWPKGIKAKGEIRHQYHHVTDIVPTILDCCGIKFPDEVDGVKQVPLPGVSMRYTFDEANVPTQKEVQYYAMLGTRGLWKKGWKAVAVHGPLSNIGHFEDDQWELFNTDIDRSESKDLSSEHPEKLKELIKDWFEEAKKYDVLPLDDRSPRELLTDSRPQAEAGKNTYIYYPDTAEVPESIAVNVRGRSYKILAEVEITDKASGVLFAHGSRFGGHSLFIKDGMLWYVYNFLGIQPEQQFVSLKLSSGKYILGMEFTKKSTGKNGESHGVTYLYVNDKIVAEGEMRTQTGKFTLCGDGLCIGRDSGDAVSKEYKGQDKFTGGKIYQVEISVGDDQYLDMEKEASAAMARE